MKKTFNYTVDVKISAWKRYKFDIDAEDRAQANELMKNVMRDEYDIHTLETHTSCVDVEDIPHSEEFLTLEDNNGEPTIEVFYEDLDYCLTEYIYNNSQYDE